MKKSPSSNTRRHLATFALLLSTVGAVAASEPAAYADSRTDSAKSLARMSGGAKIECITSDGSEAIVASPTEQNIAQRR
ncbi:MAG: hypothetical protein ABR526_12065 [Chthoniobacterales bacterium]